MSTSLKRQRTDEGGASSRLPVTVLSGFLGSGKTTILTHILNNSGSSKIALIVNDMASVNVDSLAIDSVSKEKLLQAKAATAKAAKAASAEQDGEKTGQQDTQALMPKMVSLQNGCVCCTLREDLVEQIAELAKGEFDYLIIESTGIAEPVPVAQTFCHSLKELTDMLNGEEIGHEVGEDADKRGGRVATEEERTRLAVQAIELQKLARLDTMVTVVDSAAIWDVLQCNDSLRDSKWSKSEAAQAEEAKEAVAEDLDRSIADLLIAQIEFANVILLNKKDLLEARGAPGDKTANHKKQADIKEKETEDNKGGESLERKIEMIEALVKGLNPEAKLYWTEHGKIEPDSLLDTKLFDYEKATVNRGWVRALSGGTLIQQQQAAAEKAGKKVDPCARQQISHVVFRASRPFHPERLASVLGGFGRLADNVFQKQAAGDAKSGAGVAAPEENQEDEEEKELKAAIAAAPPRPDEKLSCCGIVLNKDDIEKWEKDNAELQKKLEAKKQEKEKKQALLENSSAEKKIDPSQTFKNVFRSKGQVWLANCCGYRVMWESVGKDFKLRPGRPFDAAIAEAGYDPTELGTAATAAEAGFITDEHLQETTSSGDGDGGAAGKNSDKNENKTEASTPAAAIAASGGSGAAGNKKKRAKTTSIRDVLQQATNTDKEVKWRDAPGAEAGGKTKVEGTVDKDTSVYNLTLLVDNLVVHKPDNSKHDRFALFGSQTNSHPVWGDRGTELVFIGIALDEERIRDRLNYALVEEAEMELAAADKQRFEDCVKEVQDAQDEDGNNDNPEEDDEEHEAAFEKQLMEKTGGLRTAWDRFLELEDPFFGGDAAQKFMEFDLEFMHDFFGGGNEAKNGAGDEGDEGEDEDGDSLGEEESTSGEEVEEE